MRRVLRGTLWLALRVVAGVLAALALSAVLGPRVLDALEGVRGSRLVFDTALRVYVLIAGAAFFAGFTVLAMARPTPTTAVAWMWVAATAVGVAIVCGFDLHHPIESEPSWIRYTTAGCLLVAAALALKVARHEASAEPGRPLFPRVWIVTGVAFVYLAADELFEIHENSALAIAGVFHLPHSFLDDVTLAYAAIGLAAVLWIAPRILPRYVRDHAEPLRLFGLGAVLFTIAQILDSTDRLFLPWLRGVAVRLTTQPPRVLSDTWYLLWAPKRTFNTVEEVLENMAAALFAAAVLLLLHQLRGTAPPARIMAPRPRAAAWMGAALATACVGGIVWAHPSPWASSPALDRPARRLIGPEHGLLHADEAAYAPHWGLVVANEGAGNVLAYRDGAVRTLPFPAGKGAELDAVAADDQAIYASLPALGAIDRYREGEGWGPLASAAEGLGAPEGMAVVDSMLYSVDEHFHRMYAVSLLTRRVSIQPLTDRRCVYPEAVAFDPGLNALLVTDDKLGTILAMPRSGGSRLFASRAQGVKDAEDIVVAADGHVFVADPGRREVTEFSPEGKVVGRTRFSRMYGDVVGVEVVGARLYVVNGDASKNDAFVPSGLWELDLHPRR